MENPTQGPTLPHEETALEAMSKKEMKITAINVAFTQLKLLVKSVKKKSSMKLYKDSLT